MSVSSHGPPVLYNYIVVCVHVGGGEVVKNLLCLL